MMHATIPRGPEHICCRQLPHPPRHLLLLLLLLLLLGWCFAYCNSLPLSGEASDTAGRVCRVCRLGMRWAVQYWPWRMRTATRGTRQTFPVAFFFLFFFPDLSAAYSWQTIFSLPPASCICFSPLSPLHSSASKQSRVTVALGTFRRCLAIKRSIRRPCRQCSHGAVSWGHR